MFSFLFRLILIFIAVSVLRSVITYVQRALMGGQRKQNHVPTQRRPPVAGTDTPTTLKQDPVCGTYVPVDTSVKLLQRGEVIHFCSDACRERYRV